MQRRINKLSIFGGAFFVLALLGLIWFFFFSSQSFSPATMVDSRVALYTEATLSSTTFENIQKAGLTENITQTLEQSLPVTTEDFIPWVGNKVAFAEFQDKSFMLMAKYRDKAKAEEFLQNFLAPEETLNETESSLGTLLTPQFSSSYVFYFSKGWLIVADSKQTLELNLNTTNTLADSQTYKDFLRDLNPRRTLFLYINSKAYSNKISQTLSWEKYSPLIEVLAQNIPAVGGTIHMSDDQIDIRTKLLTVPGLFDEKRIKSQSKEFIPAFADITAHNTLLFLSGKDLYSQYIYTKQFLGDFHEDFPELFDGVLRAQSQRFFGPKFDFEKDFLSKTQGSYAFVIDQEDGLYPFLRYSFITEFNNADTQLNLEGIEEALKFAQSQFVTRVEEVELPDGTTREELVSIPADSIEITENEYLGVPYFSTALPTSNEQFSYAFINNNFVFSSHEEGMKSIIDVAEENQINLTYNKNFRETILNEFARSQNYGFMNLQKFIYLNPLALDPTVEQQDTITWFDTISHNFENFVFSKRVYPEQTLWHGILFLK